MITAIDSTVLLDVQGDDAQFGAASRHALQKAAGGGIVLASPAVWAEVRAYYREDQYHAEAMQSLSVDFSPTIASAAARAGALWKQYRAAGGPRSRNATDFLIGAHALCQADWLLTRDRGFYRAYFTSLRLVTPAID